MAGWHHQLDGPEFEQALGVGDGQGGLARCRPWGHRESDTTEQLKNMSKHFLSPKIQIHPDTPIKLYICIFCTKPLDAPDGSDVVSKHLLDKAGCIPWASSMNSILFP